MSILVDQNTRLLIQGITGGEGQFHGAKIQEYTDILVGGVTPSKGGQTTLGNVPVFNTVKEAAKETNANASIIYVPAAFAADAALEAIDAGLPLVVIITEGIPTKQMIDVYWEAKRCGTVVIGPNCPGLISPGKAKVGIMSGNIHKEGNIGLISRSGTLTYEVVWELTKNGMGQSTCIGIGGDPVIGSSFIDLLKRFEDDPGTDACVIIGEIGGTDEEEAAAFIQDNMSKPVCGFIAGCTAPPGKRMGHAGAIVTGGKGTADDKIKALEAAGIRVAQVPHEISGLMQEAMTVKS